MNSTMFPDVNVDSFCAVKKFCTKKNFDKTKACLLKIWDRDALTRMMIVSYTNNIDELVTWLIGADNEDKLRHIQNNFNLFK